MKFRRRRTYWANDVDLARLKKLAAHSPSSSTLTSRKLTVPAAIAGQNTLISTNLDHRANVTAQLPPAAENAEFQKAAKPGPCQYLSASFRGIAHGSPLPILSQTSPSFHCMFLRSSRADLYASTKRSSSLEI